jgi:hypothetical protein
MGLSAFLLLPVPMAQSDERLSDKAVKQIIEDVEKSRERFEDALDGSLKSSILRNPQGETRVDLYLDDLQQNIKNLNDRFEKQYAASREAETVLRQATDVQKFVATQAPGFKGASEWDAFTLNLKRLAGAYHTTFPLLPDTPVRRINDEEVGKTADELSKKLNTLKDRIHADPAFVVADKDGMKTQLDALKKQAELVRNRTESGQPASAEMRKLVEMTQPVSDLLSKTTSMLPATNTAWEELRAPLDLLQQAYGMKLPPIR